jgi:hypothetical protein
MSTPDQQLPELSLTELSLTELHRVAGGVAQCTPDNPTGESVPTQFFENHTPGGKSTSQSVIENTDRAMAPWKAFNGIFGGARGPGQNMPAPQRPTYR